MVRKQQDADDCSSSASATNEHLQSSSNAAPHLQGYSSSASATNEHLQSSSNAAPHLQGTERPYIPPPPICKSNKSYFSASSHASPEVSSSASPSSSTSDTATVQSRTPRVLDLSKLLPPPCPPPPPPPIQSKRKSSPSTPLSASRTGTAPPPPPPPPGTRRPLGASSGPCVRRVPEVVEFYHSLMRRESKRDGGSAAGVAAARDMIGEIENRSAHLLAVRGTETSPSHSRFSFFSLIEPPVRSYIKTVP
jgi:hypothetical protein